MRLLRFEFQRPGETRWETFSNFEEKPEGGYHMAPPQDMDKEWFRKSFPGFKFRTVEYELVTINVTPIDMSEGTNGSDTR